MLIERKRVATLPLAYAIAVHDSARGKRVLCAAQGNAGCIGFDARDGSGVEQVWGEPGGTMSLVPLNGEEEFLATNGFYTGFVAEHSTIVHVKRNGDGGFDCETVVELPYLHRFRVMEAAGETWIIGTTLCDAKDFKDDWSRPGRIYVGKYVPGQAFAFRKIGPAIFKNHGMYVGPFANKGQVAIVTGVEGAFVVEPPERAGGEWSIRPLLGGEISELQPYDIDGDGEEELIVIEKFHGDRLAVYKKRGDSYESIYSYPVAWGHALWCGEVFGVRSLLIGYVSANAALMLLQRRNDAEKFSLLPTLIDDRQGYNTIDVWADGDAFRIYAACRNDDIMLYTLRR